MDKKSLKDKVIHVMTFIGTWLLVLIFAFAIFSGLWKILKGIGDILFFGQ